MTPGTVNPINDQMELKSIKPKKTARLTAVILIIICSPISIPGLATFCEQPGMPAIVERFSQPHINFPRYSIADKVDEFFGCFDFFTKYGVQ